jgi:uncharacterized protein
VILFIRENIGEIKLINDKKYIDLLNYLKNLERVVLAFSGGVDSTFLLRAAKEALGDNMKAVTVLSPYIPKWEVAEAKQLAEKQGYNYVIDGTNLDDIGDYRPGLKALKELEIKSPLLECKLTKEKIRSLSKQLGLKTWDKPSYACLLTRIPYGNELKVEDFEKIEEAEKYMMKIGFRAVRVRCHGDLARIEVNRDDRIKLTNEKTMDDISSKFKEFGFKYVTLDLQGYRVGSLNEVMLGK